MYFILYAVTLGYFISLSIYVDAFSKDFEAVLGEINDGINTENKKILKSPTNESDPSAKLTEAILLHYEMIKYSFNFPMIRSFNTQH